jgi:hypothetical protein
VSRGTLKAPNLVLRKQAFKHSDPTGFAVATDLSLENNQFKHVMREYMNQVLKQIEDAEAMHGPAFDAAVNRMSGGALKAGARCAWCYADDLGFWGNPIPHPKDWFYSGIIVPLPDRDGRGKLEPDQCIVCVLDYPIEKENPQADWTALLSVLTSPGIHRFHVMETIKLARQT